MNRQLQLPAFFRDFEIAAYILLTDRLKIPFELSGDQRIDDTPVHIAIREALCNVLVHADYSDRASVSVVKRPDMFGFRNPGLMRIPVEDALRGGNADCRNRLLHRMFRYVGIGDQSGSGIPKILSSWSQLHWRMPLLRDTQEPFNQTVMRMDIIDLFPAELVERLRAQFGAVYDALSHEAQVALMLAAGEDTVSHSRFCAIGNMHASDASAYLRKLVDGGYLVKTGSSQYLSQMVKSGDVDIAFPKTPNNPRQAYTKAVW